MSSLRRPTECEVLIAGAGPTGLALACDLARRGVSCRIVDKLPGLRPGSRGKGLQPRTLEILEDLGVIGEILAHSGPYLPFRGYDGDRAIGGWSWFDQVRPRPDTPYPSLRMVPQYATERILCDRLEALGVRVEHGVEIVDLRQDPDGVSVVLRADAGAEESVRCAYLVGADGAHSRVRAAAGVGFRGETDGDRRVLVGDIAVEGLDREHTHAWPDAAGGPVAFFPLPGTEEFCFFAGLAPGEDVTLTAGGVAGLVAARTGRADIRPHSPSWLSVYTFNVRMAERFRTGRVFLAGDAAHVHPPAGGQGVNTGIQDAFNLGWKLGAVLRGAPEGLLDSYEEERLPVAARVLELSSRLQTAAARENLRFRQPGRETHQLQLNYRDSALSWDRRTAAGPLRAGDRAPDAVCRDPYGARVRLFDALRGPQATVLAFGLDDTGVRQELLPPGAAVRTVIHPEVDASPAGARAVLVDADSSVHTAYGVAKGDVAVIRPDGYIGLLADRRNLSDVRPYLARISPVPA
ncbi:FAD-dependent monooxygenase [Streptomyces sp. NPDC096205]|uniref:FAD-dependent monooxygenase n=1 Tax=Streptomyces sp. NPDC096205 TaxID=3366081 RepID=UPI003811B66B